MAEIDAYVSNILFQFVVPAFIIFLMVYYIFGFSFKKVDAVVQSRICKWLHQNYFEKDKGLLFESLDDLKRKVKGSFNILEIGVGSGVNFKYYPKGTHLTCVDPNPFHEYYWKKNLESYKSIRLVESFHTFAEHMEEVKSNSYDAVVCTLTLCSVKDPSAVLSEVNRVLKAGGTFFFLEHVAGSKGSVVRFAQNLIQTFWPYVSGGCHLNRETWAYLDKANFGAVQYRQYSVNTRVFFFVRPCLYGTAVKKAKQLD